MCSRANFHLSNCTEDELPYKLPKKRKKKNTAPISRDTPLTRGGQNHQPVHQTRAQWRLPRARANVARGNVPRKSILSLSRSLARHHPCGCTAACFRVGSCHSYLDTCAGHFGAYSSSDGHFAANVGARTRAAACAIL